MDIVKVRF